MLANIQEKFESLTRKRQSLLKHLDSLSKENELVYRHPYGGPLDIDEALQFIDVHCDNHMRHIDRILAQAQR